MFKKIDSKMNLPKMEEEILKFWEEDKIFEKSVEKNPVDKPFIFYEGPPTANGMPGLHHVLARAFKDIIPRYKTMKGYRVERKAGWDTHGLPVEIQVEKELGIHQKSEIENIIPGNPRESIIEFNKKCKESVWKFRDLWEKMTRRMGYWVDMENPYVTYENKYIESVWWVVSEISKLKTEKGEPVLYQGHKVIPYCYRCGTALSSHEVAQGYQKVKDNSVVVKFKLKRGQKVGDFEIDDKTYFLVWTTTPWTLPGNVALAVGKDISYILTDINGENVILKQENAGEILEKGLAIVQKEFKGKDLLELKYEPLYKTNNTDKEAYYVISGDFITTQEGTAIVHIAPAFGEDDARVGQEHDLPTLLTVDIEGKISADVPGKEIPVKKKNDKNKYAVDDVMIKDLKKRGLLFKEELYEHDYPYCWRCDTPLIYYAKPSWFVRMSAFREILFENNQNVNWIPEYIKEGRFGEWLCEAKDWAISRDRYWGTPLPIWKCKDCEKIKVVESQNELEKLYGKKLEDLHKPFIDEVTFKCECGEDMRRELEVMDVWFDSGSMPTAQFHYPNGASKEEKQKIESGKFYPADYISEAIDQTRGWFYTLHAIATLLNAGKKVPAGYAYKNVICLGHILDANGKKMSKSKGNVIEPMEVMDKYGADMLRWMLYTINQPGLPKRFDIKKMNEIMNRVFRMLWNSYSFFILYANIDKFKPSLEKNGEYADTVSDNILDRWILSELFQLINSVDRKLEIYDIYSAAGDLEKFIDNLSNWYIRRSRKRFWKSESDEDKNNAYNTLHQVLVMLSKLMAPFAPFISEEIYKNLTGKESVHLAEYPQSSLISFVDEWEKYIMFMNIVRSIVNIGLQQRAINKIKVRQPLKKVTVKSQEIKELEEGDKKLFDELKNIIKEELNVKDINFDQEIDSEAVIDTEITEDLKLEGQAREIIRYIQEMRKAAGFEVDNRIILWYNGMLSVFEKFGDLIAKETLANSLDKGSSPEFDFEKDFDMDGEKIRIQIKKINNT
jgi:isoleucyl-tRNA synthetase